MRGLADRIEAELRAVGTPARAAQEKRYLKSDLVHLGASVPDTRRIARTIRHAYPGLGREGVLGLARALWRKPIHECRAAAVMLLELDRRLLVADDLAFVEALLREARGWALVDDLAANVAGDLVERYPRQLGSTLDRWARDDDFWLRRSALLALLLPLRRGQGDFARFCCYADAMLEEKEFFIRKAIGWVLRETAKRTPGRVLTWLLPRAGRAAGLTVREAGKPLPARDRARLLAAHRRP